MLKTIKLMGAVAKESITHPNGTSTFLQDEHGNVKVTRKYKKKSKKENRWSQVSLNWLSVSYYRIFIIPVGLAVLSSWLGGSNPNKGDAIFGLSMVIYLGLFFFAQHRENNFKN